MLVEMIAKFIKCRGCFFYMYLIGSTDYDSSETMIKMHV